MRKGFTLAEVLITIAILGVIIVMTAPTIVKDIKTHKPLHRIQNNLDYDFTR